MCATCGCDETDGAAGHLQAHDHGPDHDHGGHGAGHQHLDGHDHHHGHSHPVTHARVLRMEQAILAKNDRFAAHNRAFFRARGVLALNVTSSPGAGKTTLLERLILDLGRETPVTVIEGDQETENDARRIRATGCRAIQINTGAGCHLDAERVGDAARALEPTPGSLVLIENVGNLVCPAMFDLGERAKVVVLSVTEGEDKPVKYPHMFRAAGVMVLSKTDLLPHLEFDADACVAHARRVNPALRVFPLSAHRIEGMGPFYAWVRGELAQLKEAR
jgi:hydrogenase nickel incorporation protein HypB